ncbi:MULTISPECIES: GNAT family N-acetyltransferase [Variovorax]|uniref:GNAT family N-acetyltransferase n=1 Tax=Variovorax TaxID=34072 RepID=UPI00086950AF|nr:MULTISPECIES: GNAT family N-acetyltransferase [Variovorax]MBN8754877.1 N-acetyltransferase [Variovorax sp.]ODU11733.1 MAG: GNAT family N-acetyltransferase [Variovorax sp. SCN 67-85]ODV14904.1 MAG: GNAT family N-acetyltransferase [Variovorax sp. SCN 67-20]OJZ05379.1 MAG: GNAT family N-acetyltransferase [Variovorax sp. 67-131]UKI05176.1 GNAT family N-acetyltransferase [Variovorax paradoxus]
MNDYVIRVLSSPSDVSPQAWNALLATQAEPSPFMRHEYLSALHESGSATPSSGWTPQFVTLWRGKQLQAACPLYIKDHSYGEYVFDWAWANAYEQHGLAYYPKAVVAVPFTPVPGTRLLARDAQSRTLLVQGLVALCKQEELSSLHLLFGADEDIAACTEAGLMLRNTVQFHWTNAQYADFDSFLASLSHDKRKKIRQERRKVADAGVSFRWSRGADIPKADWDFFYRCYERTYREHGNPPYLTRDFFRRMADTMPEAWLLFIAERNGKPMASSLIALSTQPDEPLVAYGRYWGALERVDCLHFEACYYQPLAWCIAHGAKRFEGGAQGEHKMARALMPVKTTSAHWLAHPAFADAVERFLEREGAGIENYMDHLGERSPFKAA